MSVLYRSATSTDADCLASNLIQYRRNFMGNNTSGLLCGRQNRRLQQNKAADACFSASSHKMVGLL